MTIWLDMDGVLADFNSGYQHLAGFKPIFNHDTMEVDWSLVDSFPGFFAALDPMPDAKMLEHVVRHYSGGNYGVLTSLPYTRREETKYDKRNWLMKHFVPWVPPVQFVGPSESKASFCKPHDILIDDWPGKHRKAWEDAGGKFIWHVSAHDTIRTLRSWGFGNTQKVAA